MHGFCWGDAQKERALPWVRSFRVGVAFLSLSHHRSGRVCLGFISQFSRSVQSDSLRPHESQHAGLSVHHHLPEFTQTHVHGVGDAIQPSHPRSSPSPPAPISLPASESFPMSQLFTCGGQSIGVSASASVLPVNTQD